VSDVWQGPGWWLASDGKWYPADAEPGAVYEGSVEENDEPAPVEPAAPPEVTAPAVAETSHASSVVDEASAPPRASAPYVEPPSPAPSSAAPIEEATAPALTEDPFSQMPAPVIEEPKVGGWQAVRPDETPEPTTAAPIPTAPLTDDGQIEEEGWTSAYEERQSSGDVLDEVPAPAGDAVAAQIPDVAAPTEILRPQDLGLSTPPTPAPPVSPPASTEPDLGVPADTGRSVATPPLVSPPVEVPQVAAPVPEQPETAVPVPDADAAIERDGAWRKPLASDAAPIRPNGPPVGAPDVVDLAIPDEPPEYIEPPESRNWVLVGGIIIGVLAVAGLAWLIASVFTGDDDTNTGNVADGQDATTVPIDAPSTESTEPDEGSDNNVSVFALRAGDCIVGDIGAGQVTKVTKVDCEVAHQFEVYREALIDTSIATFNEEAISSYAEEVCRTTLEAYIPSDDERGLKFKFLQPTEDSWNQPDEPDRVITCLLFDEDAPLVGRAG